MTLAEVKKSLLALLATDMKSKILDDVVVPLVNDGIEEIAIECEPLNLLSRNVDDDVLKFVDDEWFVKVPNRVENDDDEIPLHGVLNQALVQYVAMHISRENKEFFAIKYKRLKRDYMWQKHRECSEQVWV